MSSSSSIELSSRFSIATLNVWGLPHPWPLGSRHRKFRIGALIEELSRSHYDVVTLQELWSQDDFLLIARSLNAKFPFSHYFHSGFTGSGVCILSQHPIVSTLVHRYSLNGFPHHIHRGDWFGGKIVGMAQLKVHKYNVHIYTTHLHAEYNRKNDLYLPHRTSQCFELAQFVRHTCSSADFIVLTGDFNIEPSDLGYHLVRSMADLTDAWVRRPVTTPTADVEEGGMTCERPDNFFTSPFALRECPNGKRLDYIMYRSSGQAHLELTECEICFNRIDCAKPMNFSDHVGVCAKFHISQEPLTDTSSERLRHLAIEKQLLEKSLKILEEGEIRVLWDRRLFLALCFILVALIVATINIDSCFPFLKFVVAFIRFAGTLLIGFSLWHGFIGLTIEFKALQETRFSIRKLLKYLGLK